MDMYQKRKMRKEKNESKEAFPKVGINWYITHYDKLPRNAYVIRNSC